MTGSNHASCADVPRRALTVLLLAVTFVLSRSVGTQPAAENLFPLKIGPTGRYLVDRRNRPFLIAGESPQAMMVNISEADADLFFANRRSHGFNAQWINLICATYTGGREDSTTIDGVRPFLTPDDFSTPNEAYFAHCDRVIRLAARYGMVVFLDPAETGSFPAIMKKNGVAKCREYGRYLGKRYSAFDNIVWLHGNDYGVQNEASDALVTAIALGIKEFDHRHLHTVELGAEKWSNSLDDVRWAPILGINAAYTYGPTYMPILEEYNRQSTIPTFMVESGYEFEHLSPPDDGSPRQLRNEEYGSDLSGSSGQFYGNGFTWPFKPGWKDKLDTPGAIEMKYVQALFQPRPWWKLVPDQDHKVVTAGFGTFGGFDYVSAGRTPDGRLVLAYVPDSRTITVDMSKLSGPTTARWFDPANGKFQAIERAPIRNVGLRQFVTPGDNADGAGNTDWVLVLEAH